MTITPAGLRAWAQGLYPLEAAVELVVRCFAGRFATPGNPWIQPCERPGWWWLDTAQITDATLAGLSGGEQRVLRIAASLAAGAPVNLGDTLPGLDRDVMDLVLAAMAHANGSHDHPHLISDHERGTVHLAGRLPLLHPWRDIEPGPSPAQ